MLITEAILPQFIGVLEVCDGKALRGLRWIIYLYWKE